MSASAARSPAARLPRRARSALSVALAILAAVAVVVGGSCLYVREELLDSGAFADRTVATLGHEPVRRVIAREVTVQVIGKSSPDLLAARPLINSVVEAVVATPQFRSVIRLTAGQAHRLLFDRGGNVAFSIADAGAVVLSALRTLAPSVAGKIPQDVDAKLLDLRKQSFAVRTLRAADKVRLLGLVLPFVALALLVAAVAVAPRRRIAVTRCAVALAVAGAAAFVDLLLVRHSLLVNLFGSDELTNADVREAAGVLWQDYVGDLSRWAFGLAAVTTIVAASSASVLRPYTAGAGLARMRMRLVTPRSARGRFARGAVALALGVALLGDPLVALDAIGVIGGVLLFYLGVGEALSAVGVAPEHERFSLSRSRGGALAAAASLAALTGGVAIALARAGNTDAAPRAPAASALSTCNGYAQLCSRRIDEVVFAGTHNAMSAADSPGWFIANQSHGIARQLDDGLRAFKISTHYGEGKPGNVRTDITAEGARANRVSEKLTSEARAALQRFSGAVGFGRAKGRREVWLCHTLCELGATNAVGFFATVRRFLQLNPGQVVVFFDEDYVSEASLEDVFKRSGLYSHLAVLRDGQQLPTLGQLVRSQRNVLVFTQEPVSGRYPWDMYAFGGFIQDTPLGAVKPGQFTCKLYRGTASSPLLMMNDWADVFPPRRSPNVPLTQRAFILERARQCEAERHHVPNLILTDFYETGDVVGAARVLNGLGDRKPAPIVALERR
ncbi:MAG TPA: hypothetical protein VF706_04870 [Solirubrobacteraceae bacterium]